MNSFAAILSALLLVLPAFQAGPASTSSAAADRSSPAQSREPEAFRTFRDSVQPETQAQVRIEQHVTIRITPSPPALRREMFASPVQTDGPVRFKEKKHDHCVAIEDIAGISPMEPNRLVLFMRNHNMLSASLERACDADAFYLGAYVERNPDGKLCTGRDTLRARTGATCRLSKINRLVAIKD